MNLLTDPWVPVRDNHGFRQVKFRDILCGENDWRLSARRDDLELAALQMLVCLAQVIFTPADRRELIRREAIPLDPEEFERACEPFREMFDLFHAEHPFMQNRGVTANEVTPIQKLFIGLPEGNSHMLFNPSGELSATCPSCTAIVLFNYASNCPSFGGGFKGSLRGSSPITTLLRGGSLRCTIWRNILSREALTERLPLAPDAVEEPVWKAPLQVGEQLPAARIGLLRGLFWQPAHLDLTPERLSGKCDCCGMESKTMVTGLNKEKFKYDILGVWPHPHSPRTWSEKGIKYVSFTTTAPAWTRLNEFLIGNDNQSEGHAPAAVVSQFASVWPGENLHLSLGGYQVNQASVLERRHEMLSLSSGWEANLDTLAEWVDSARQVVKILSGKVFGFGKAIGLEDGLSNQARKLFYDRTEHSIHFFLQKADWDQKRELHTALLRELMEKARQIFTELTEPYSHDPGKYKHLAVASRKMNAEFAKLLPREV